MWRKKLIYLFVHLRKNAFSLFGAKRRFLRVSCSKKHYADRPAVGTFLKTPQSTFMDANSSQKQRFWKVPFFALLQDLKMFKQNANRTWVIWKAFSGKNWKTSFSQAPQKCPQCWSVLRNMSMKKHGDFLAQYLRIKLRFYENKKCEKNRDFLKKRRFCLKQSRGFLKKRRVFPLKKRSSFFLGKKVEIFSGKKRSSFSSEKRSSFFLGKKSTFFLGKKVEFFLWRKVEFFSGKKSRYFPLKKTRDFFWKKNVARFYEKTLFLLFHNCNALRANVVFSSKQNALFLCIGILPFAKNTFERNSSLHHHRFIGNLEISWKSQKSGDLLEIWEIWRFLGKSANRPRRDFVKKPEILRKKKRDFGGKKKRDEILRKKTTRFFEILRKQNRDFVEKNRNILWTKIEILWKKIEILWKKSRFYGKNRHFVETIGKKCHILVETNRENKSRFCGKKSRVLWKKSRCCGKKSRFCGKKIEISWKTIEILCEYLDATRREFSPPPPEGNSPLSNTFERNSSLHHHHPFWLYICIYMVWDWEVRGCRSGKFESQAEICEKEQ